ncbi:hypothetical protein QPX56_11075, partial [Corynebacterium pseudodiphtheriticum]|uniref:hypothetical protein n=2 Tax=Corynebacterium pseudodiphtheriticum TaxID=37637 RepID=UPI0025429627
DLRPADGSDALGVDAVVDKYADEVRGKGLDFGAANDEAAWKSEFAELVKAKERALYPEFYVAEAADYFEHAESLIAADLRPADGSDALGVDAVVDKYADEVRGKGLDFGAANDEAAWKSEFAELVKAKERALYPEFYVAEAADYFAAAESLIAGDLRPADGSDALGVDAVVDKYADEVRGKGLDFGAANDEAAWKSEFAELVKAKERALYPEFYVAEAADYFAAAESLIAGDLRPADGSDALGVDAVVDKYADEVRGKGLDFGAANDEAAWKSE